MNYDTYQFMKHAQQLGDQTFIQRGKSSMQNFQNYILNTHLHTTIPPYFDDRN